MAALKFFVCECKGLRVPQAGATCGARGRRRPAGYSAPLTRGPLPAFQPAAALEPACRRQPARSFAPPVADWAALRLFGQYRLVMLIALAAVYYIADDQRTLGTRAPELFETALLAYAVLAFGFQMGVRLRRPRAAHQLHLQCYADILFIVVLAYASGGVQSGVLGPWLLVNMALLSHFSTFRHALLFAAIAALSVLCGELSALLRLGANAADFERTALLGCLFFIVAWLLSVPVRQLAAR